MRVLIHFFHEMYGYSMSNMMVRIIVGLIGIPFLVWIMLHGGYGFLFFTVSIAALAQWEFYKAARHKGYQPMEWMGIIAGAIYLASVSTVGLVPFSAEFIIGTMALLTCMAEVFRRRSTALANVMTTIGGFVYIPFMIGFFHLMQHYFLEHYHTGGRLFTVILFAGIWLCDSAAYFSGKFLGKHKLLERVSPKKTWEGAIGGFIFCIAGVYGLSQWLLTPTLSPIFIVLTGAIIGTIGQIGDLFESLIKRDAQIKDSSGILPGHGGILDRFDSALFVAPAVWILIMIYHYLELPIW